MGTRLRATITALLVSFLLGACGFVSGIIGDDALPAETDVVGSWTSTDPAATLTLNADHTFTLDHLAPGFTTATSQESLRGLTWASAPLVSGTWTFDDDGLWLTPSRSSQAAVTMGITQLLPSQSDDRIKIVWPIGDPDAGVGLVFR